MSNPWSDGTEPFHKHLAASFCVGDQTLHVWSIAQSCPFLLRTPGLQPAQLLCSWEFPGKNAGLVAISSSRGSTLFQVDLPGTLFPGSS